MKSKSIPKQLLFLFVVSVIVSLAIWGVLYLAKHIPSYAYPNYIFNAGSIWDIRHVPFFYLTIFILGCLITCFVYFNIWKVIYNFFKNIVLYIKDAFLNKRKRTLTVIISFVACFFVAALIDFIYERINGICSTGVYFCFYRYIFFVAVLVFVWALIMFGKTFCQKPEKAFVMICLVCGLLMCGSFVGNVSWDDETHYDRALNVSDISFTDRSKAEQSVVEKTYNFDVNEEGKVSIDFNLKNIDKEISTLDDYHANGDTVRNERTFSNYIQFVAYLPSAIALFFGNLFGLAFHTVFLMGKVANLIAYTIIVYFAIKKLKSGKFLFMSLALLPTCLFLATNYSYDFWTIGFVALALSYIIYHVQTPDEKIKGKDIAIIYGSLFFGIVPKAIYFPLVLFGLLIGKKKFEKKKSALWFKIGLFVIMFILILTFVAPMVITGPTSDLRGGSDVNASLQISYILKNPGGYARTFFGFLGDYLSVPTSQQYTSFFAYLGASPFGYLALLVTVVLAFVDKKENDIYTSKAKVRIWVGILTFITLALVVTSLYVDYTPVGSNTVDGCQPRYLIPLLFGFYYILGSGRGTKYFTLKRHSIFVYCLFGFIIFGTVWLLASAKYY